MYLLVEWFFSICAVLVKNWIWLIIGGIFLFVVRVRGLLVFWVFRVISLLVRCSMVLVILSSVCCCLFGVV